MIGLAYKVAVVVNLHERMEHGSQECHGIGFVGVENAVAIANVHSQQAEESSGLSS